MSTTPTAPETLTRKLLRAHLQSGELAPGTDVTVAVDQILIEDATGTMCAMQFEMLAEGSDTDALAVPLAVMYVDHNVLQIDDKNMQDHRYLRSFSQRYGLLFSRPATGSRTTYTWNGSPGPVGCSSAPTRTARWPARSGCSRRARAGWRSRSPWPGTASTCPARAWWAWS